MALPTRTFPYGTFFSCKKALTASLPVGAIPTIAAAGSETSDSAVLSDLASGEKRGLGTVFNRPKFTIMDPTLTVSLPPRQTACGVTDIMMHTILPRYRQRRHRQPGRSAAAGRYPIRGAVMANPADYKARSELMWAGSLSHNGLTGLGQSKDFSVHQLGHALSAKYDIPHGESLSAVWARWAKTVYREDTPRFAQYARNIWLVSEPDDETAALAGIEATNRYFRFIVMLSP
jgi:alcohol dehydrogenase YqhD (iron-dependent ADH family)